MAAQEWLKDSDFFTGQRGEIQIGQHQVPMNAGEQERGGQTPPALIIAASGNYDFSQAILLDNGVYLVKEENLNIWLSFNNEDFRSSFSYTSENESSMQKLGLTSATNSVDATISGTITGGSNTYLNEGGTNTVSCNLNGESLDASSQDTWTRVSINQFQASGSPSLRCWARAYSQGAVYAYGSIRAVVNTGLIYESKTCNSTPFGSTGRLTSDSNPTHSFSSAISCEASGIAYQGYVYGAGTLGISSSSRYVKTDDGIETHNNKNEVDFSYVSGVYVSPGIPTEYYLQRGNQLFVIDSDTQEAVFVASMPNSNAAPVGLIKNLTWSAQ